MAKLKYKDRDGFWQELPVGTNVVANPMLTGTEQELTSLKVGDAKYKIPASGGEKVSITVPQGATNGTITDEQLVKLQENDLNYIEMVNDKELYYLNDPGHEDGYLTYSHVGIENSKATIKTLTITVSAKSFVIVTTVVPTDAGGGKLYRHTIQIALSKDANSAPNAIITSVIPHPKGTALEPDEVIEYFADSTDSWYPFKTAWGYNRYSSFDLEKEQYTPVQVSFGRHVDVEYGTLLIVFVTFADGTDYGYGSALDNDYTRKSTLRDTVTEL